MPESPVVAALVGAHVGFAERVGQAVRYATDVAPFGGFVGTPDDAAWADLATLVGPGGSVAVVDPSAAPAGWEAGLSFPTLRMVAAAPLVAPADGPEVVTLTRADVPDVLDLVRRTDPGPFRDRTLELGTYLGIRVDGHLAAMAGERLHPPGRTEISAVCTDPMFRGRGFAATLVRTVAAGVDRRGETAFLHVVERNVGAIRLYESLGFVVEASYPITVLAAPR